MNQMGVIYYEKCYWIILHDSQNAMIKTEIKDLKNPRHFQISSLFFTPLLLLAEKFRLG